jgi:hypothetical protein
MATSATSLPDSVWQRVTPIKFGTASNTARRKQASKSHVEQNSVDLASFLQPETSKRQVVQEVFDPTSFHKLAGSKFFRTTSFNEYLTRQACSASDKLF